MRAALFTHERQLWGKQPWHSVAVAGHLAAAVAVVAAVAAPEAAAAGLKLTAAAGCDRHR